MTQIGLESGIDTDLLLDKAEGSKQTRGKILSAVKRFSLPSHPSAHRNISESELTDKHLLVFYDRAIKLGGSFPRGIGENSVRAMSDYLQEKGMIGVDYRLDIFLF